MKLQSLLSLCLLAVITLSSCETAYKFTLETPSKTTLNQSVIISLKEKNNQLIDSVQFFVKGKKINSQGNTLTLNTNTVGLGKHVVSALAFYPGKTKKKNNSFEVLADKAPAVYKYKIVNTFPHDTKAYTQGLEYHNGFLYESTGRKGQSTIRKVELKTGKVLKKIDIDKQYFAEGMTIFDEKIFLLTWKSKKGFVYNIDTFKQESEFAYNKSKEGWGLTHSETELIKSDGTNKIWFLDPITQKEKRSIQVYTNKYPLKELNEIELVNGKIYANKWQQNVIVIINPETGATEGIANLTGLKKEMEKTQKLVDQDEVLNGIAYDSENNRLFVTGKYWGKVFEIELIKK
jgi:glutamine cyclotransferase